MKKRKWTNMKLIEAEIVEMRKAGRGLQARQLQNLPMTHIDNVLFWEDIYDI